MQLSQRFLLGVAVAAGLAVDGAAAAESAPRGLYTHVARAVPQRASEREAYAIEPTLEPFAHAKDSGPIALDVGVPGGVARDATLVHARGNSWRGKTAEKHDVVVDSDGRRLYAHLFTGRELWVIHPDGAGGHRLVKIDGAGVRPDATPRVPVAHDATTAKAFASAAPKSTSGATTTIDVLFLFTREAATAAGGDQAALDLFADHAVSVENTVLSNSQAPGVEFRRIAAVVADRGDGNTVDADLSWAQSDPAVGALRDQAGADVVVLIGDYDGPFSGTAYVQSYPGPGFAPFAFAVADLSGAQDGLTLQHEFGHLLGMEHDPDDSNPNNPPAMPFGYGHIAQPDATHTLGFFTVMSYQGGCGGSPPCYQVPYYSNASVTLEADPVQGRALGIADQRENYRLAVAVAPVVAGFRDPPAPLFVDGFE